MKNLKSLLLGLLLGTAGVVAASTFTYFTPATGILKGNANSPTTTAAASSDVVGLWSGTCDNTSYLRGDGACGVPSGAGSVTSVGVAVPSWLSVAGSPVTGSGTITISGATGQTQNRVIATPNGSSGAVSLRALVSDDLPSIDLTTKVTGILPGANGGTNNGFTVFTGPASSLKTFTLPNASATILTSNAVVTVAQGGSGVGTLTGPIKGNGTSAFSAAAAADIYGLWSGSCSSVTYLRGDGSCQTPSAPTAANPTSTLGLTAVNGVATTFMRSDASPALSVSISPTWSGTHTFSNSIVANGGISGSGASLTSLNASNLASGTVPDGRFPATLPAASGVNLTALNATNLGSGTVPDARFPSTLPAVSGVNLTALNASNLGSGTVSSARVSGTYSNALTLSSASNVFTGDGSALTALNATQLTSGTLPTARLSGTYSSAVTLSSTSNAITAATGTFTAATVGGSNVCRADGVDCPGSSSVKVGSCIISGSFGSSSYSIARNTQSMCSSITYNSAGNVTLSLTGGYFATGPVCTMSPVNGEVAQFIANNGTVSTASMNVTMRSQAGTSADGPFSIICVGS